MSRKLSVLTLFNWGVYSGRCSVDFSIGEVDVSKRAVCLTGETGSGKTTITDAYLALIRPKNADSSYNAASNGGVGTHLERRTTMSYVRGDCGKDASKNDVEMRLRSDDVVNSAIVGDFVDDSGEHFYCARLMQWFEVEGKLRQVWITSTSAIDVEKFNVSVGTSELSARLVTSIFKDATVYESVGRYEQAMGRALGFGSDSDEIGNVTRLLSMVQGEKLPSNVGTLFKDYVLKAVDVRSNIRDCVDTIRHEDSRLHEMELTQKHMKILESMSKTWDSFVENEYNAKGLSQLLYEDENTSSLFDNWKNQVLLAYSYIAKDYYEKLVSEKKIKAEAANVKYQKANDELEDAKFALRSSQGEAEKQLLASINVARGAVGAANSELKLAQANLDSLDADVKNKKQLCDRTLRDIATVEKDIDERVSGLDAIVSVARSFAKFDTPQDLASWSSMVDAVAAYDANAAVALQKKDNELYADIREIQNKKIGFLKREIADMKSRKSRIPSKFAQARAKLCKMMGVQEIELPFVGELFDMLPDEEEWRLAANSAYGSLALRLLVDVEDRAALQRAADRINFGFRLNYDAVNTEDYRRPTFTAGGLAEKFEFDETSSFCMYVQRMLASLDYVCVDDITKVSRGDKRRFVSLTGQIANGNRGSFGYSKDRSDIIGFENASRLEDLESELYDYENDVVSLQNQRKGVRAKLKDYEDRANFAATLRNYSWEKTFDVSALSDRLSELESDKRSYDISLSGLSDERDVLILRLKDAKDKVQECENEVTRLEAELDKSKENADEALIARVNVCQAACDNAYALRRAADNEFDFAKEAFNTAEKQLVRRREYSGVDLPCGLASDVLVSYLTSENVSLPDDTYVSSNTVGKLQSFANGINTEIASKLEVSKSRIDLALSEFGREEAMLVDSESGYDWRYASVTGTAWAEVRARHEELGMSDLLDSDEKNHMKLSWLGYYEQEYDALRREWSDLDMESSLKAMCSNSLNSLASLQAQDGSVRRDVASRVRAVNTLLHDISLSEDKVHYLEVRSRVERQGDTKVLFDKLSGFAQQNVDFAAHIDEIDVAYLRNQLVEFADALEAQTSPRGKCFLDPRDYVRITFTEHRGDEAITHSGTGKLSGGEMQQMSACIVGAALLYVMGADAGHGPTYETIVLDEAFVKSDEKHARDTLRVLMRMGFYPVVAMPPTIVMSVSPCLSKMLFVTKTAMGTSVVHESKSLS